MSPQRKRLARRAYAVAIGASLAVHSIFFPLPWTAALLALIAPSGPKLVEIEGDAVLPLEVELEEPAPAASGGEGEGTRPIASASASAPAPISPASASAAASASAPRPASSAPAKVRPIRSGEPASSAEPVASGGAPAVRDPIGLAGKAGAIAAHDPNVSLMLALDLIRTHPAGKDLGPALANMDLWQLFFTGTDVDPIRDLDRLLIAGPTFSHLTDIVAVVKMKDGEARLHHVYDVVRGKATPPGEWVSDEPPVAKIRIGTHDHFFVENGGGVGMIVPEKLLAEAKKQVGVTFPSNKKDAVVFFMRAPSKQIVGGPIRIPATLQWVRLSATLRPDGSATVLLDMLDADAATATVDADFLTKAIEAQTTREVPFVGKVRMFDPVAFTAHGAHVGATTIMQPGELRELAKLLAQTLAGAKP